MGRDSIRCGAFGARSAATPLCQNDRGALAPSEILLSGGAPWIEPGLNRQPIEQWTPAAMRQPTRLCERLDRDAVPQRPMNAFDGHRTAATAIASLAALLRSDLGPSSG